MGKIGAIGSFMFSWFGFGGSGMAWI